MDNKRPPTRLDGAGIVILLFTAMFGVIGVVLLVFLWSPADAFPRPPILFRLVGSCIAGMFMLMGFGIPLSALARLRKGESAFPPRPATAGTSAGTDPAAPPAKGYQCPNCGATLGTGQEVSPSGDAKCTYCHRWWNIHRDSKR